MDQSTVAMSANSKASKATPDAAAFFCTDLAQMNAIGKMNRHRLQSKWNISNFVDQRLANLRFAGGQPLAFPRYQLSEIASSGSTQITIQIKVYPLSGLPSIYCSKPRSIGNADP